MSTGIAKRSLETMIDYANQRRTFGKAIVEHGQIQEAIEQPARDEGLVVVHREHGQLRTAQQRRAGQTALLQECEGGA